MKQGYGYRVQMQYRMYDMKQPRKIGYGDRICLKKCFGNFQYCTTQNPMNGEKSFCFSNTKFSS